MYAVPSKTLAATTVTNVKRPDEPRLTDPRQIGEFPYVENASVRSQSCKHTQSARSTYAADTITTFEVQVRNRGLLIQGHIVVRAG